MVACVWWVGVGWAWGECEADEEGISFLKFRERVVKGVSTLGLSYSTTHPPSLPNAQPTAQALQEEPIMGRRQPRWAHMPSPTATTSPFLLLLALLLLPLACEAWTLTTPTATTSATRTTTTTSSSRGETWKRVWAGGECCEYRLEWMG